MSAATRRPPIPGTHESGFSEQRIIEVGVDARMKHLKRLHGAVGVRVFEMGECRIIRSRDDGHWHLSISCPDRHPSWDEIKTARYRLLPLELTFGMLLPPPEEYINVPEQDHVFHLWEVQA